MTEVAASDAAPRIAFIPVSGPFGMGEYARSLAIARATRARWPHAEIHFMVSREAPYANEIPFPATLLPASATFHSAMVIAWMESWLPTVVVFDNAGRSAQLRAARRLGAKVIYISARRRQRRKAFRLRWMRILDEHWIAYPAFIAGAPRWYERLKLRLLGRPRLRFLDVILSRGDAARGAALLSQMNCMPDGYVLVVPGGGTGHPGAADVTAQFLRAAETLAAQGVPSIFVGPAASAAANAANGLHLVGPQPQADLAQLMVGARVIVANGGSTLLQAVACARPCVAVGIADDQAARIERCVAAGVALAAPAQAQAIAALAAELWARPQERAAMAERARALGLADGLEVAIVALQRLIGGGA